MPTIRIEYEVPEGDCEKCDHVGGCTAKLYCKAFNYELLELGNNFRFNRCQACIEAEVKVQPE